MKIIEITEGSLANLAGAERGIQAQQAASQAAPVKSNVGSFGAKAGVFARAFGRQLGQQMFGSQFAQNTKLDAKSVAKAMGPVLGKMAQDANTQWTSAVSAVMSNSKNARGQRGTTDFNQITNSPDLSTAAKQQVDALVKGMGGVDLNGLMSLQSSRDPKMAPVLSKAQTDLKSNIDALHRVDPGKDANTSTNIWLQIITNIQTLIQAMPQAQSQGQDSAAARGAITAKQARAQPGQLAVNPRTGDLTIDGMKFDPKNPMHLSAAQLVLPKP